MSLMPQIESNLNEVLFLSNPDTGVHIQMNAKYKWH